MFCLFVWISKELEILREVDNGGQRIKLSLPAVITCDLRLNEPRFATLQNIMKAKKKPLEEINLDDMGIKYAPNVEYLEIKEPPPRKGGALVENVEELFEKLKAMKIF
ncbi:Electron transfer flavoprotein subunit beta [Reticulomyxa filosa]|uniref:Electron transfer flavoprotein subunit beta n=1 Tax=Reticulomyxa filosa TaxID=46433 RepID=X6M9D5_RETFI|nr:Electron transfer flavoprotein subunit beta [Reticulomyxa filosa]|eukprot:ETO10256.1 Electron transfer flavoprotein subunit beta [Reticulomyxa filosa]